MSDVTTVLAKEASDKAMEILRRMLDERGVEWDYGITGATTTRFSVNGIDLTFTPLRGGLVCSTILTPEQAIAATLGAPDAKPTQAESSGTCHDVWDVELTGRLRFQCSECGAVSLAITPRFCPACGRKVVEPTKNDVDVEVDDG